MVINVNLTYANYPITVYIITITILFFFVCLILFLFTKSYFKQDAIDKLIIHLVIIFCFGLLIICYIFSFVEILLSEKCLIYKLISIGFLINKIFKNIFFCITKNSIMLLLLEFLLFNVRTFFNCIISIFFKY